MQRGRVILDRRGRHHGDPKCRGDGGLRGSWPTAPASDGGWPHWQRAFAAEHDTVTEGRDQGTIVFPDAFRKFFLMAAEEERARRRLAESLARGEPASYEQVLAAQRLRDRRDAERDIAPMRPAADAIVLDTGAMTIDEVVEELARRVAAGSD